MLRERRLAAVVFAVADRVGVSEWERAKGAGVVLELLDGDGLGELAASGAEIGSHAATHRPLTRVPADELDAELTGSAGTLESLGLPRPRALAYPHGDLNEDVAAAARRAGYAVAFTVRAGTVRRGADRLALPRIEVLAGDTPGRLRLKLATADWPSRRRRLVLALARAVVTGSSPAVSARRPPKLCRSAGTLDVAVGDADRPPAATATSRLDATRPTRRRSAHARAATGSPGSARGTGCRTRRRPRTPATRAP